MSAAPRRKPGRPPGVSGTRDAILAAARAEFAANGYDRATIRGIARSAGVDPALVHHYFGTKTDVFAAAVQYPVRPTDVVELLTTTGPEELGMTLASLFVRIGDDPEGQASVLAIVRSAVAQDEAAAMFREFISRAVLSVIAPRLPFPEREARARLELAVSHMVGLTLMRHVMRIEPVASMPADELVARVGPVLQHYFDPDPDSRAAPTPVGTRGE